MSDNCGFIFWLLWKKKDNFYTRVFYLIKLRFLQPNNFKERIAFSQIALRKMGKGERISRTDVVLHSLDRQTDSFR